MLQVPFAAAMPKPMATGPGKPGRNPINSTVEPARAVPRKFGCVMLVTPSAFEKPLSLRGLSAPVTGTISTATVAGVDTCAVEPALSTIDTCAVYEPFKAYVCPA